MEELSKIQDELKAMIDSHTKEPNKQIIPIPVFPSRPLQVVPSIPTIKEEVTVKTDSNKIIVGKGYAFIPAGTYNRYDLENLRNQLITAYRQNKTMVDAAKWIIENTPKTVAPVRAKLDRLLLEGLKLQNETKAYIKELDTVLGFRYNPIY